MKPELKALYEASQRIIKKCREEPEIEELLRYAEKQIAAARPSKERNDDPRP